MEERGHALGRLCTLAHRFLAGVATKPCTLRDLTYAEIYMIRFL